MIKDLAGQRFGRLTVISYDGPSYYSGAKKHFWKCRCDCGNEVVIEHYSLLVGNTKSCGCLRSETKRRDISKAFTANTRYYFDYNGNSYTASQFAKICGITRAAIYTQLKKGKTESEIVDKMSKKYLDK